MEALKYLFKWAIHMSAALFPALVAVKADEGLVGICGFAFGMVLINFIEIGNRYYQKALLDAYRANSERPPE